LITGGEAAKPPLVYSSKYDVDAFRKYHPLFVEGQIEGGSLQAVGWALLEEVVMKGGRMANGQLTNYIIPTTLDTPAMAVEIVEHGYANGPFGAKGVGEPTAVPTAAAIMNAIYDAVGARIFSLPATPERVLAAIKAARAKKLAKPKATALAKPKAKQKPKRIAAA
jgi:CO/xanthine dehydrogenase Mo-binding subunit